MLDLRTPALLALAASLPASTARAAGPGVVVQHGEVIVMEGDAEIVGGEPGARRMDPEQQVNLLNRFYQHYPDEFDQVIVWTTWADLSNPGAYFTTGVPSPSSRLLGFVNMNQVGSFGAAVLPVLGQEFSHAWLAYASFVDPATGAVSNELLGRMGAHWSQLLDAEGSVQDGIDWKDNGDGTFTVVGANDKLSPLDLWYMGFVGADEVPPFFLLRNARVVGTEQPVGPLGPVSIGTTVRADRVDLTIGDIIAAEGPQPPVDTRQHDFRLAFVLVTDIGQSAQAAAGTADQLELIRQQWNVTAEEWFLHRGSMCTDATAPCDVPHARFGRARALEAGEGADGDGVVEPGERAVVEVVWLNTGIGTTSGAVATLSTDDPRFAPPGDAAIADIPEGGEGTSAFELDVPADVACGEPVAFRAVARVGTREFHGALALAPGVVEGQIERFTAPAGYEVDPDGTDTAMSGAWEHGVAELIENEGRTLQPEGGADGPGDGAWWTGPTRGFDFKSNDLDTGVTTLVSAPIDATGLVRPRVRYRVWYAALGFNGPVPVDTAGDELRVEASTDGGASWVEIDRVEGEQRAWELREAPLDAAGLAPGRAPVRIRFVARDQGPEQNVVEVGIDDVQVISLSADCDAGAGGGCGCRVGSRPDRSGRAAFGALGLLIAAAFVVRNRRCARERSDTTR